MASAALVKLPISKIFSRAKYRSNPVPHFISYAYFYIRKIGFHYLYS